MSNDARQAQLQLYYDLNGMQNRSALLKEHGSGRTRELLHDVACEWLTVCSFDEEELRTGTARCTDCGRCHEGMCGRRLTEAQRAEAVGPVYVIADTVHGDVTGFAVSDPIEGWIFTSLLEAATKFDTLEGAKLARRRHYDDCDLYPVMPVVGGVLLEERG